jgi:endonuclease G, mitochondrial
MAKRIKRAASKRRGSTQKRKPAAGASAKGREEKMMAKLKRYVRANAESFLADPNITSIGIGYKRTAGQDTSKLAIQFSVRAKVVPEGLPALGSRMIPTTIKIDGLTVPTDVIERSYRPAYRTIVASAKDERRARADTVRPGISVGCRTTTAGTLGTFVRDRQSRQLVMLSNWHVFQGAGGKLGDDVLQPGKFDDNRAELNLAGKLLRSHLGPAGDCAIASVSGRSISNQILGLGVEASRIGEPQLKDRVVKSGRTTAVTYGIVTRLEVNTRISYPGGIVATVGGFEIGTDISNLPADNEISRGGDSGSAWMAVGRNGKATDVMLGLHFAGDGDGGDGASSEFALACYANSVMNKLEVEPAGAVEPDAAAAEAGDAADAFRGGFDKGFLPFAIDIPRFSNSRKADLAALDGGAEVRYCHFSVWLSKERRYPTCVAWNIDGGQFKRVKRVSFRTDRRGELEKFQLTNDIYVGNVLDKGHIARRADLCWGSLEEARQGNYDSFYYTNIAPQHEAFNQSENRDDDPDGGIWGRLENTVFDTEDPHNLRVSVLGGPVISSKDRKFIQNGEECFLPREYWKVVAYVDDRDGREKAFAFILTQANLIEGLVAPEGLDFDAWLWARITLQDLQSKTGVIFPAALKDREVPFVRPQALGDVMTVKPLYAPEDYFAS